MASDLNWAAHVGTDVGHTAADAGFFGGLALGILGGLLLIGATVLSGGTALAVIIPTIGTAAGAAATTAVVGGQVGRMSGLVESGHIARGSDTTFYGPQTRPAARMHDRTACYSPGMNAAERFTRFVPIFGNITSQREMGRLLQVLAMRENGQLILPSDLEPGAHPGSFIADGSRTVSIDRWPAARRADGVFPCDGKIIDGIESIQIGGPRGRMAGTEDRNEIDATMRATVAVLDFISEVTGSRVGAALFLTQKAFEAVGAEDLARLVATARTIRGVYTNLEDMRKWGDLPDDVHLHEAVDAVLDPPDIVSGPAERIEEWRRRFQPPPAPPPEIVFDPRTGWGPAGG